ncbi:Mrp family chromosome partitioning ATPase [Marinobacterium halophilum]|uniref:Iron-sulfur cluster carrier protein n=1 Tax=Marinobacterium halophilum TaxID=267374 RepID=A0A2P8F3E6_9GAMM|nr:Mrp/NBP35 family ATP-binding protein [Marinobacterium halophilum]PSL16254.1 Mrp family chromosome partitioning ATPase [Marinobacterium halophilum]
MSVSHFSPDQQDPLALRPEDCNRGHACQFCPQEDSCLLDKSHHEKRLLEQRLDGIGQIILVMANKGGVGKSTVTANLAAGLAQRGYRVGVADADIHGPNQSRFFNLVGQRVHLTPAGLGTRTCAHPALAHPIRVGSLAFLMDRDDTPIVWRDAYKHDFMHHLIGSFDWGELDVLLIDMPPGTGNELITLADLLEHQAVAALIATTPQEVALMDSLKAIRFCQERGLPLIGVVENMAGVTCPNCGEEFHLFPRAHLADALAQLEVNSIAQIPLSPQLALASDTGHPMLLEHPDSTEARAFAPAIDACIQHAHAASMEAAAQALEGVMDAAGAEFMAAMGTLPDTTRDELTELLAREHDRLHKTPGQP